MSVYTDLYDSVYNDVVELTKRPDLESETAIAVRTATSSIHARAAFPRDSVVQLVKIPNSSFITSLDAQLLFPGLRGLSTVRLCDVNYDPMEFPEIEIVEMGDIYDPIYRTLRNNIAYLAGTSVIIRSGTAAYGFVVEYFKVPSVRRDSYNSWIAQLSPDVIVHQAASLVFATNGNEEKSQKYAAIVDKMLFPELLSNYLTTAMR